MRFHGFGSDQEVWLFSRKEGYLILRNKQITREKCKNLCFVTSYSGVSVFFTTSYIYIVLMGMVTTIVG